MGTSHLLYGRNVLKEALSTGAHVSEIFYHNDSARDYASTCLKKFSKNIPMQMGIPREFRNEIHQGIAFKVNHDFYVDDVNPQKHSVILMCNHLEDVQNLGSLTRAAAAFGAGLIVHEDRRSVSLTPAAIKASAGQAFRVNFLEVANLTPLCKNLRDKAYEIVSFGMSDHSCSLYEWKPSSQVVLILGSEGKGVSKPLEKMVDYEVSIPMKKGVESLNVAQAGTIAMSWVANRVKS